MKYDLIVVGGGPGGLMAAKQAAEDGLKVVLVERKKNIIEVNRSCGEVFYIRKLSASKAGMHGDGYIEPVSLEVQDYTTKFHFPGPGFSLDFTGAVKPYINWIEVSPNKTVVYRRKNYIWGYYYDKEAFLKTLLEGAKKAGAEILSATIGMAAENTRDGVKVQVRGRGEEQTLEAKKAIAADGTNSLIVDSVGLNKKRKILGPPMGMVEYELEGMEIDLPSCSWIQLCVPSINRLMTIFVGQRAGDRTFIATGLEKTLQQLMKYPTFEPWFRNAQVVKRTAVTAGGDGIRTPVKEPVEGNVFVVGDAGSPVETWIQGAVASAYMAVKAIEKELNGLKGYQEYIDWWQQAFYFHKPEYWRMVFGMFALANSWQTDDDVDYLYSLIQDKIGVPQIMIEQDLEQIKEGRPELYERLKKGFEQAEKMADMAAGG
jgi:flavin-dependent dehydrogenase